MTFPQASCKHPLHGQRNAVDWRSERSCSDCSLLASCGPAVGPCGLSRGQSTTIVIRRVGSEQRWRDANSQPGVLCLSPPPKAPSLKHAACFCVEICFLAQDQHNLKADEIQREREVIGIFPPHFNTETVLLENEAPAGCL